MDRDERRDKHGDQHNDRGDAEDFRPVQHPLASIAAEHGDIAGHVGAVRPEQLVILLALCLGGGLARLFQCIGPALRGQHSDEVGELTGLQGEELIAGLRGLSRVARSRRRATGQTDRRRNRAGVPASMPLIAAALPGR